MRPACSVELYVARSSGGCSEDESEVVHDDLLDEEDSGALL